MEKIEQMTDDICEVINESKKDTECSKQLKTIKL